MRARWANWAVFAISLPALAAPAIQWRRLSSRTGDLPVPGASTQQTGALIARLDNAAPGFVLSFRKAAPALVWYRRTASGWERFVIEQELLPLEAGGAVFDIDGDGDLDVVFGADSSGNGLWWWENPSPVFDPKVSWKRHMIKNGGANQHHDQIFADLKGEGRPQLIFWNQRAKTLFLAPIPADPRNAASWRLEVIYSGQAGEGGQGAAAYAEGLDAFDVDGDGRIDLLAGNYWFKYLGGGKYRATRVGTIGGRIRAGRFRPGRVPQIVIAPGDGSGPLKFYECRGDPSDPAAWVGRDLLGQDMIHGHTLDAADVNGDGHLDILAAEMAKWTNTPEPFDHTKATAWILYGDGRGNFEKTVLSVGSGWHEGKLGDLDGDGDIDVLQKPYTWDAPRIDVWLNNGTRASRR